MESCRNQKHVKLATLAIDIFAQTLHSLNQLHLECFSNSLEGVPTYVTDHLGLVLCSNILIYLFFFTIVKSKDTELHNGIFYTVFEDQWES
jgi:hypothetical protein